MMKQAEKGRQGDKETRRRGFDFPLSPCLLVPLSLFLLTTGCRSAVEVGQTTALEGADLVAMTDDMSMRIIGSPAVQQAIARDGTLRVVMQPVQNYMTAEVLPRGPATAFVARVRALLAQHAPNQFTWVMNRDDFYMLREQEVGIDLGPNPERIQPDYALTARFDSLADEDRRRRTAYYLCAYELTDLRDGSVLWTGRYEVRKVAVKGFMDR
jgi:hypothetical protein